MGKARTGWDQTIKSSEMTSYGTGTQFYGAVLSQPFSHQNPNIILYKPLKKAAINSC